MYIINYEQNDCTSRDDSTTSLRSQNEHSNVHDWKGIPILCCNLEYLSSGRKTHELLCYDN